MDTGARAAIGGSLGLDIGHDCEWLLENARTYWSRGEEALAKRAAEKVCFTLKQCDGTVPLYSIALCLLGKWHSETRSAAPKDIIEKYLEPAVTALDLYCEAPDAATTAEERTRTACNRLDAHATLAEYADTQFRLIQENIRDSSHSAHALYKTTEEELEKSEAKFKKADHAKQKNNARQSLIQNHRELDRHVGKLRKKLEMYDDQKRQVEQNRGRFLKQALEHYCDALSYGDGYEKLVHSLCSLWFTANKLPRTEAREAMLILKQKIPIIPTYKWLELAYQLSARLTVGDEGAEGFNTILEDLVVSLSRDHPHHVLNVLIALRNGNSNLWEKTGPNPGILTDVRAKIVDKVMNRLKGPEGVVLARENKGYMSGLINGMFELSYAYVQLANLNVRAESKTNNSDRYKAFEGKFWLAHARKESQCASRSFPPIQQLENIAVLTRDPTVDKTGTYKSGSPVAPVGIHKFENSFQTAGGINLPKIINCIGTNGCSYKQVVKGEDDMRQDAVMQQVFRMVNAWLAKDPETQQRRLSIRTYRVVSTLICLRTFVTLTSFVRDCKVRVKVETMIVRL